MFQWEMIPENFFPNRGVNNWFNNYKTNDLIVEIKYKLRVIIV